MGSTGKYEKTIVKSMLKKLLSLNLIDENEFRTLADNINLDIEKNCALCTHKSSIFCWYLVWI